MTTRLLLVRHGETDANAEGRTQGRRDVPLNVLGRRQAEALAGTLQRYEPCALYSSPASRARDTAAPLASALGFEVQVDERLAELDQGVLDGLNREELRRDHADFLRRWREEDPAVVRMPDGESMADAQTRMVAALVDVAAVHPDATVVVVSHNLALRAALCHALGVPLSAFRRFRHDLASLAVVDVTADGSFSVVTLNERCHPPDSDAER